MAATDDDINLFALPDFWRSSKWLDKSANNGGSFFALEAKGNRIACPNIIHKYTYLPSFVLDAPYPPVSVANALPILGVAEGGFFGLPPTAISQDIFARLPPTPDIDSSSLSDRAIENDIESQVWMELDDDHNPEPSCRTWEDFNDGRTAQAHRPMFLSEAGHSAYDYLLSIPDDPLHMENSKVPIVEPTIYFSSLLQLALAQQSALFNIDVNSATFTPVLPTMRIPGYSRGSLHGVETDCIACAKTILDLRAFASETYSKPRSRCGIALASSINLVLQASLQHMVINRRHPKSLLQLQSIVRNMTAILKPFQRLMRQIRLDNADHEILSIMFQFASLSDSDEPYAREMARELLQRVSGPWIMFLEEWMGTKKEQGIPLTKTDVGTAKGFVKVELTTHTDDFGRDIEEVDFQLMHKAIPEFMPTEMMESIFQTGRSLRFIKAFHSNHLLAQPDSLELIPPPSAQWIYSWQDVLQLEERVTQYRDRIAEAIENSQTSVAESPAPYRMQANTSTPTLHFFANTEGEFKNQMESSMVQMGEPARLLDISDSLSLAVYRRLGTDTPLESDDTGLEPHWSLIPTLSFGSIAIAQAQIIGREALRLLFDEHDIKGHLKLHRDFHLMGNGMFCSRLSHALFDPDLETAERIPGVARQGGVMGLRLGGRDTWPPASSELRLALMGILAEAYQDGVGIKKPTSVHESHDLPGDLSFAVRDLSEEEIEKCMDADSLEALDFLRLSYTTPPELSAVITPIISLQYDRIYKLLLRVLRMVYIVNVLFRDVNLGLGRLSDVDEVRYRFVREAQHVVSSVATYFLDTGISLVWATFEDRVNDIRANLSEPLPKQLSSATMAGPEQLGELHSAALQQIMGNLFLRKRQQHILDLLEGMFTCILKYAKYTRLESSDEYILVAKMESPNVLYGEFRTILGQFIGVCHGLSEKTTSGGNTKRQEDMTGTDEGLGEESMVGQLLMKLDMFDYYLRR